MSFTWQISPFSAMGFFMTQLWQECVITRNSSSNCQLKAKISLPNNILKYSRDWSEEKNYLRLWSQSKKPEGCHNSSEFENILYYFNNRWFCYFFVRSDSTNSKKLIFYLLLFLIMRKTVNKSIKKIFFSSIIFVLKTKWNLI